MSHIKDDQPGRLPVAVRDKAEEIIRYTDRFCAEHLDDEYAALCRKLAGRLARKRPSPLVQGELRSWAVAIIYVIGQVNYLSDPAQKPHLTTNELSELTGVSKSTLGTKAKRIRDLLRISPLEPDFYRREILLQLPLLWIIEIDGLLVDARSLSPEIQEELRRRGIIPALALQGDSQVEEPDIEVREPKAKR